VNLSIILPKYNELLSGACSDTNRHNSGNNRTMQIIILPARYWQATLQQQSVYRQRHQRHRRAC